MNVYDFDRQLGLSHGNGRDHESSLMLSIPHAAAVSKSSEEDDRQGTDYWVTTTSGHRLSVDLKWNSRDPIESFGADTLLIEWWSAVEFGAKGWTVDPTKRTDYVLYWFQPTSRYALVPFPLLYAASVANCEAWQFTYDVMETKSTRSGRTWTTTWSPVNRKAVWRAIYDVANGQVAR